MRRNEFLVSLGALIVAPFLPRQGGTVAKRPTVGHGGQIRMPPGVYMVDNTIILPGLKSQGIELKKNANI